jgi:endogenous inhibitor of DNA gyrase (YacG/DUF329 family)
MGSEGAVSTIEQMSVMAPRQASGAMALAMMSEEDFSGRLDAVQKGLDRVRQIQRRLMTEDEDYGVIPGTKKPTLLKPGAEKLCAFYGLVATYEERTEYGDGQARPWITVKVRAIMHLGAEDGPIVGEGLGSANSSESKHKYRSAKRSCPACGSVGSISKSKYPDKVTGALGWYCRDCKANFAPDDVAIVEQALGQIENPDPADVENTCLKMSKKRAFIDGTLTTTATSGLFTQDLEDMGGGAAPTPASRAPAPAPERQPGEDGEETPAEVYERAGVDPPAPKPRAAQPQNGGGARVPCPHCGKPAGASKYPNPGKTHYCYGCKHPFDPSGETA